MSGFIYRRLYQMRWRLTRPARTGSQIDDQVRLAFVEDMAHNAVNGYACFGQMGHPGCASQCPYDQDCQCSLLEHDDRAAVIVRENDG